MSTGVVITPADSRSLKELLRRLSGRAFSWVYLGQSIEQFEHVKNCFSVSGFQIDTANSFHQVAQDLREPYLSYVYDMGREYDSLLWWVTSLSYRRREVSKTFLQACYLRVALDLAATHNGLEPLVLVTPDMPLRRALAQNLESTRQARADVIGPLRPSILRPVRDTIDMLARRAYFIAREGRRIVLARWAIRRPHVPCEPTTLIVSSVSRRNVGQGTDFHTFFFGDLVTRLRAMGLRVATVPLVLREIPYLQALLRLRNSSVPLLVPHRYVGFFDLVRAAIVSVPRPPQPREIPGFAGMDITPLVKEDLRAHWVSNRAAEVLLLAASVRRWGAVSRIIYVFENQPWERGICWQARRSFPGVTLVGYQHARVPLLLLPFYLAPGGESRAPLPDRVVTAGRQPARLLSSGGHGPHRVRVGGSFQMNQALTRGARGVASPAATNGSRVLVACSEGLEETAELAVTAVKLFGEGQGIEVVIKFHPVMPLGRVSKFVGDPLPAHVNVSDEPIVDLMAKSSLMVYTGTTVCIQALAMELPVVHLRPRFEFDFDPLSVVPEARLEATGLEELRQKVRWLLDHREEYVASHRDLWGRLVQDMHGPVTEETYRAFVD